MDLSSFLGFPPTLAVDTVERSAEGLVVSFHATTSAVSCPRCGTAGSRVHSRYVRTVADLTCVGQRLILKLLVRNGCAHWTPAPNASLPNRIQGWCIAMHG